MKRREFITLLGAGAAWPLVARAQQPALPVIGYLATGSAEVMSNRLAAFRKGLSETGYVEGHNVAIEYRWAQNEYDRLPELAADLVRRRVAVIATPGSAQGSLAAKAATTTIPVVFSTGVDPVKVGLVASLNRPGGNVTGVISMTGALGPKQLGLLQELLPGATRFAVLANPNNATTAFVINDLRNAALTAGGQIDVLNAATNLDIDTALASLVQNHGCTLGESRPRVYQPLRAACDDGDVPPDSDDLFLARICRSRWADELWNEPKRHLSSGRHLYWSHPQGGKSSRLADCAGDQVRACRQPTNGKDARTRSTS